MPTVSFEIEIAECASCGGPHRRVIAKEYSKAPEPWTHYYTCEETGDPVSIHLRMVNGTPTPVDGEVMAALHDALGSGKGCVVAVFTELDNGRVLCRRFSREFPVDRYTACVEALQAGFDKETGVLPKRELPAIDPEDLEPVVNLFDRSEQD